MNRQQPMDLAELRVMVAQHLLNSDRKSCSLVCKAWYASFNPTIWSTFRANLHVLNFRHSPITSECPMPHTCYSCSWRRVVIKHGYRIRHLKLSPSYESNGVRELFQLVVDNCTSLTALTYPRARWDDPKHDANKDLIMELMRRNPLIQSISTSSIPCLQQAMVDLPKLTRLEVDFHILSDQAIETLLRTFTCLQELQFTASGADIKHDIHPQPEPLSSHPSSLKKITWPDRVPYSYGGASSILKRCPALEFIDFGGMSYLDDASLDILRSSDSLPRLSTLSITGVDSTPILMALARPPWILHLRLVCPWHGSLSVIAEHYAQHLQNLDLTSVNCDIHCPMVLFAKCSALKTLNIRALGTTAFDLRRFIDQPWACTQLEELEIPITLEERSQRSPTSSMGGMVNEVHRAVPQTRKQAQSELEQIEASFMERLGCLTQLRRLALHPRTKFGRASEDKMLWQLRTGFCHLQGLNRLEVLDLGNRKCTLGIHEFEWMKTHWTSLSRVVFWKIDLPRNQGWFRNKWPEVKVVECEPYFTNVPFLR